MVQLDLAAARSVAVTVREDAPAPSRVPVLAWGSRCHRCAQLCPPSVPACLLRRKQHGQSSAGGSPAPGSDGTGKNQAWRCVIPQDSPCLACPISMINASNVARGRPLLCEL